MQEARGCEEETEYPVQIIDGKKVFRCPAALLTDESRDFAQMYVHYKNGHLPVRGGLLEQTSLLVQAIAVISGVVEEIQLDELEKARQKMKKGRKRGKRT